MLLVHALRNPVLPLVSLAAVQLGMMLSGSIVIESVFAINGLGRLAWESLLRSDLPVVQAIILILSLIYVTLTTAADPVSYTHLDVYKRQGQDEAAAVALDELAAQRLLQPLQGRAHRGLAHEQTVSRPRDAALLDDDEKGVQQVPVEMVQLRLRSAQACISLPFVVPAPYANPLPWQAYA